MFFVMSYELMSKVLFMDLGVEFNKLTGTLWRLVGL